MKAIAIFLFFLSLTLTVIGQSHEVVVSGAVKSNLNKSALPYANILVENPRDSSFVTGTVSDEEGRFELAPLRSGEYILLFSHVGYNEKSRPVSPNILPFLSKTTTKGNNHVCYKPRPVYCFVAVEPRPVGWLFFGENLLST
jgi:hypothetical protein